MDISNLGTECYERFPLARVLKALREVKDLNTVMDDLTRGGLTAEEENIACDRAKFRLNCYYEHLQNLIARIEHQETQVACSTLKKYREHDEARLREFYASLAQGYHSSGETTPDPGLALFLQIGDRSIALLPRICENSIKTPVYMASKWQSVTFEDTFCEDKAEEFRNRIERSNRLWQRERWWVLPVSDSAEPLGLGRRLDDVVYFNNISLHKREIDGWVDAFWGVQCGIRLALPIRGHDDTKLVMLLTTFLPDAFKDWDESMSQKQGLEQLPYVKAVPDNVASKIVGVLVEEFGTELDGLSFATLVLKDVSKSETSLIANAMKLLAHYSDRASQRVQNQIWEVQVFNLLDRLSTLSPNLYEAAKHLESPRDFVFKHLEALSEKLPDQENAVQWKNDLKQAAEGTHQFSLLPTNCTVGKFFDALKSLEKKMEFTVNLNREAERHRACFISSIPSYLLTAIAENLVEKRDVTVDIDVNPNGLSMDLTAFYHKWKLSPDDERDFLLKPLNGGRSTGFYLTAQVLWRYGGAVEYYRIGNDGNNTEDQALMRLQFPFSNEVKYV